MVRQMEAYRDNLEHVLEELGRLDLLLRRAVVIARASPDPKVPQELRGLVVSEEEVGAAFPPSAERPGRPGRHVAGLLGDRWQRQSEVAEALAPLDHSLHEARRSIDERRRLTEQAGRDLALPRLARVFGLSPAEVDLLLIALAPELEPRYEMLYSYLQMDATRKRPSVDLALNVICRSAAEKVFARRLLSPEAPLRYYQLVTLLDDQQDRQPTFLRRFLKADESTVRFLISPPALFPLFPPVEKTKTSHEATQGNAARRSIQNLEVDETTRARLTNLVESLRRSKPNGRHVIQLISTVGPPAWEVAEAVCASLGAAAVRMELSQLQSDPSSAAAAVRDAALGEGMLVVAGGDAPDPQAERTLWSAVNGSRLAVVLLGPASSFGSIPADAQPWRVEVPPVGYDQRRQVWARSLAGTPAALDANRLADTFQFGPPLIRQTARLATALAALRTPRDPTPSTDDVLEAGRSLTTPNLSRFALPLTPRYGWDDLVLPEDKMHQLKGVEARVRHRQLVHREWGFGQKLSRGKGLNVLFTGASGTGKTMAAEVLAGALALTLHQIDLSTVISKYIGETEQHLSAIFREAESSQTLLFFDEAEALFGKRTEVKDAHDRYANIEVNYLLQRIEQYEGIVVLATNLHRNLDDAFLRRISEVVEFPMPDEAAREQIWRKHFPSEAPTAGIDFAFLATHFKLAGGNIRNVALGAAYAAAQDGGAIDMAHIIPALETEYQKLGRLVMENELGPYLHLTRRRAVR
jgi:SpoVK/Ycf46/Vps4 family AAA+-type ATPase